MKTIFFFTFLFISLISYSQTVKTDSIIEYDKDGNLTDKTVYTYDSFGNENTKITYVWNTNTNDWLDKYKDEYTYDDNGNLTLHISYEGRYYGNDNWINDKKNEYTYYSIGKILTYTSYDWSISKDKWVGGYYILYNYSNTGIDTSFNKYRFNKVTNDWDKYLKVENDYDNNNNLIVETIYFWEVDSYVLYSKVENTYDNNNNLTTTVDYYWNDNTNSWTESYKKEITYDDNGNLIKTIYLQPSYPNWKNEKKDEYTYDDNGYLIKENIYYWDSNLNDWENGFNFEYTNDNYGNLISDSIYYWDSYSNDWVFNNYNLYFFSNVVISSITEQTNITTNIFPNPTTNYITINNTELKNSFIVELYNLNGTLVYSNTVNKEENIYLDDLQRGIYFVKIIDEDIFIYEKIIKQ